MLKTLIAALIGMLALAVSPDIKGEQETQGEQGRGAPRQDEQWQRLQALRVYSIIDALELDATSERGLAILGMINRFAESHRRYVLRRSGIVAELFGEMRSVQPDEEGVARLVSELEEVELEHLAQRQEELAEMNRLLTPLERARLLVADEMFRRRLRDAMRRQGHGGSGGVPQGRHRPGPR